MIDRTELKNDFTREIWPAYNLIRDIHEELLGEAAAEEPEAQEQVKACADIVAYVAYELECLMDDEELLAEHLTEWRNSNYE